MPSIHRLIFKAINFEFLFLDAERLVLKKNNLASTNWLISMFCANIIQHFNLKFGDSDGPNLCRVKSRC